MKTLVVEINGDVLLCQQFDEIIADNIHIVEGVCPDNDKGYNAKLTWNGETLEWVETPAQGLSEIAQKAIAYDILTGVVE